MLGIYVIMRCIEDGLHEVSIRELSQVFYIIRKMCGDGELYIRAQRDGGRIENEIRSMIRFLSSVICHLGVFYMHFIRERDFQRNGKQTFDNTFDSDPLPLDSSAGSSRDSDGAVLTIDFSTPIARSNR